MATIDLNCDMGEGCDNDAELMKYISSANVACGFHAGDLETMRTTVGLALDHGVAIGAHPGYPDRKNFGRLSMDLSTNEVFNLVTRQLKSLGRICREAGAPLHHVKPHGALYNQAAKDCELAGVVADAVVNFDPRLILYGLSGSFLISEARKVGLQTASEVFADRTYQRDGTLTPRTESNALITDDKDAVSQALQMVQSKTVTTANGVPIRIEAETLCIHADGENAVVFAKSIREVLVLNGVGVVSPGFSRSTGRRDSKET